MNAPLRTHPLFARALLFFVIISGFAAPASALVILSEIFYDAEGSDDGHVFVELAGPPGTLLDGWQVEGVNGFNGCCVKSLREPRPGVVDSQVSPYIDVAEHTRRVVRQGRRRSEGTRRRVPCAS